MTHLIAWLADVLLGPTCPLDCGHRARGPRTLHDHITTQHPGWEATP